jgi:hypothetical protein
MDRVVTVATDRNGFLHLLTRESFAEPFIGMTRSWDQVMFGR